VGDENRVVTDLKRLEKSQFETANLKGKRLALITDSSRFGGEVSTLKAITGSDPLPYEKKGIQAAEPFVFRGLVMVAANEAIQSSDYTSGLARRKIPVQFEHRVSETEKQRYRGQGGIIEVMKSQMPGLVNWILSLDEADALNVIMNPEGEVLRQKIETEISVNPILGWLDERVVQCQRHEESYSGDASSPHSLYLYPNYIKWCENQGCKPRSVRGFRKLVAQQCGTYGIATSADDDNKGAYLKHLRLRRIDDINTPPLISSGVASTV
jgi:putative DNA primase/helicase